MTIIRAIILRIRLYQAGQDLGSRERERRMRAMDVLTAGGSAALPTLKWLCRVGEPLAAFGATVVLHRLGDPAGLEHLVRALRWILPNSPTLSGYIEEALVEIGPPDASRALVELWPQLPPWDDGHVTLDTICRVWQQQLDPRAIAPLIADAHRIPVLFERTIPAFGQMAVTPLQQMSHEPYPEARVLAIRAVRHISGDRSRDVLLPLLRDSDAGVREDAALALQDVAGTYVAGREIGEAMRAGYSSRPGVEILRNSGFPGMHEPLLAMIARWPSPHDCGDTSGAVVAALDTLRVAWAPAPRMLALVCALVDRKPQPDITLAAVRLLAERAHGEDYGREAARVAMWPLLASPVREIRTQAALGMGQLGDPLGRQMLDLLDSCRPHGSILQKIHTMLRGGPDASAAANNAIVQLTQWVNRVSRETVERFGVSGAPSPHDAALRDPRLPGLMHGLLSGALRSLESAESLEEIEEAVSYSGAAGIRVLSRLGAGAVQCERGMLVRALRAVKCVTIPPPPDSRQAPTHQEVAALVRMAAADAVTLLGPDDSLSLLMETAAIGDAFAGATAITAIGRAGDPRAISYLQGIVANGSDIRAAAARDALNMIRRTRPAAMTLLRASSSADAHVDRLVRPVYGVPEIESGELLLRPAIPDE